jgi:voltage-gated potassium channel
MEVTKRSYKEWIMAILAVLSVSLIIVEDRLDLTQQYINAMRWIDDGIWLVFCMDYAVGLKAAESRKAFVREHIIELIAILPFNAILKGLRVFNLARTARMARLLKTVRLVRLLVYLSRAALMLRRFFATNNFYLAVIFAAIFISFGAMGLSYFENMSIDDAIWSAFVITTNGDITPATIEGRFVAAFLMLTGVGFVGILTGTVATFLLTPDHRENSLQSNPHVEIIIGQLERFDELTGEDVEEIGRVLVAMKGEQKSIAHME